MVRLNRVSQSSVAARSRVRRSSDGVDLLNRASRSQCGAPAISIQTSEYLFTALGQLVLANDSARQLRNEGAVLLIVKRRVKSVVDFVGSAVIAGCHHFPAVLEFSWLEIDSSMRQ